ncbi:hypothetical protein M422DRAFT_258363 [Sphaerobolus stellatus SS14]|uniref:Uncharacterized protein n=1 Tax=Sphaerobolus stellatus (strain SS14) TaxID=990650 RepID=A0A0C9VBP2_SPHS4|nr:hypothetical protein M422DRAFT_258363 [Sphaerobolus stellatus SS14]
MPVILSKVVTDLTSGGATGRVTGGRIVQKRTLCQLEPRARKCQAAWSDLREMRDTSRPAFSCPTEWITNCPGFFGCPHPVPTKSLPCALARGDNDRDRIEKD